MTAQRQDLCVVGALGLVDVQASRQDNATGVIFCQIKFCDYIFFGTNVVITLLSLAKQLAFMTISRTEVAGSSKSSTRVAPRNVSLISLGCISASKSDDWLYNAAVIRSADFKPSSVENNFY